MNKMEKDIKMIKVKVKVKLSLFQAVEAHR
jgi:hypothetical protein